MEITSREELVDALTEAAELEHGLLCQYVFAAVSLKQTADEGITWPQAELVRGWKRTLLEVARQEMAHLGTVCNLLTAIGSRRIWADRTSRSRRGTSPTCRSCWSRSASRPCAASCASRSRSHPRRARR